MIALELLVYPFVWLLLIYAVFIQHERGGLWRICKLAGIIGYPLDVALNYLHVSLVWGWPGKGQHTISQRIARLKFEDSQRGKDARLLANILNRFAPSGNHV